MGIAQITITPPPHSNGHSGALFASILSATIDATGHSGKGWHPPLPPPYGQWPNAPCVNLNGASLMTRRDYEKRNLNWRISVGILISRRDHEKRNLNRRISVGILMSWRNISFEMSYSAVSLVQPNTERLISQLLFGLEFWRSLEGDLKSPMHCTIHLKFT